MQTDPELLKMTSVMSEDELHEQFEAFDPTNEKILMIGPKESLEKLKADLRKVGYRTDNKHFRK